MQIFDSERTRAALPFDRLIPALRAMFANRDAVVPARGVHTIADPQAGTAMTSLVMPAWLPGVAYAVKVINIAPANAARGLPGLHASVMLFDARSGVPLALIDGDEITARRTAAASALAASWLAREDARHLLVVGGGRVARLLPLAYREVRRLERISVWTRDPAAARRLAADWQAEGFDACAVQDLADAASQADIVSCATLARAPVIQGRWLAAGSHLDLIGSFTPEMREADDDAFRAARLYVDTEEAFVKSGELLEPMKRGVFAASDMQTSLASLSRDEATGRRSADERTVFKSVGSALEDLAAAMLVAGLRG